MQEEKEALKEKLTKPEPLKTNLEYQTNFEWVLASVLFLITTVTSLGLI